MKDKEEKKEECSFCKYKKLKKKPMKESFAREGNLEDYLAELAFAKSKPFKVQFNEGISVSFLKEAKKPTEMTPEQKKEKEKISGGAKEKGGFKKYGKRAAEVRSRTAIKMAKKLKPKKK